MKLRGTLIVLALLVGAGTAAGVSDRVRIREVNRDAKDFGYHLRLAPPDPCSPPDPCKERLDLTINTTTRTDLDQQITLVHTDTLGGGEGVNPCVRIQHAFRDAEMVERVDLIDPDDKVLVTVPAGYHLQPTRGGYVLARNADTVP